MKLRIIELDVMRVVKASNHNVHVWRVIIVAMVLTARRKIRWTVEVHRILKAVRNVREVVVVCTVEHRVDSDATGLKAVCSDRFAELLTGHVV